MPESVQRVDKMLRLRAATVPLLLAGAFMSILMTQFVADVRFFPENQESERWLTWLSVAGAVLAAAGAIKVLNSRRA